MDYKNKYVEYKSKYLKLKNEILMVGGSNYLKEYTILKTLGAGHHGNVFLAKNKTTEQIVAIKIEKIFESHLEQNYGSYVFREIDFVKHVASKYPQQFMQIYEFKNEKCNFVYRAPPDIWKQLGEKGKAYHKKLALSKWCSIKIMSTVNTTLKFVINSITNKKNLYELFIQMVNVVFLISKHGYIHTDLNSHNVGLVKTTDEYLSICNKDIPTNGYFLQAIDYGNILHTKYNEYLSEREQIDITYYSDLDVIFEWFVFKLMLKNLTNSHKNINIGKKVKISDKHKKILKKYLVSIKIDDSEWSEKIHTYFNDRLYKIMFFDDYQKSLGIENKVELFDFIPISGVCYIVENFRDIKKLLEYLTLNY